MDTATLGERCLSRLRDGILVEDELRELISAATRRPRQDILYLQTTGTSLAAEAIGIALVIDGRISEPPEDPAQWPYRSPLAAMADGWRVIKFPEMALLMDPDQTVGLGCEFILERWS